MNTQDIGPYTLLCIKDIGRYTRRPNTKITQLYNIIPDSDNNLLIA